MENLSTHLSLCPHQNCFSIPRINLINNSKINITCNEHSGTNNHNFEISRYLSLNNNITSKLICSLCYNNLKENEDFLFCKDCEKFFCIKCHHKNNHNHELAKKNISNFWIYV